MRENIDTVPLFHGEKRYLFISYSHRDTAIVEADKREFIRHGVSLWQDERLVWGTKWDRVVKQILLHKNCACVMFYISADALLSSAICKELKLCLRRFRKQQPFDKNTTDAVGGYFFVTIGGKTPDVLKQEAMEKANTLPFFKRLRAKRNIRFLLHRYSKSRLYGTRSACPEDLSGMDAMLDTLSVYDVVKVGVYDNFRYDTVAGGHRITKYFGVSEAVTIPNSIAGSPVVAIGKGAFAQGADAHSNEAPQGAQLRHVEVPDTVTVIEEGAFKDCAHLESIRLPAIMERLGVAAFRGTTSLEHITLPNGITVLEEALFRESGITEICVPEGVTHFGEAIFRSCRRLTRCYIPNTVRQLTEGCFYECLSLRELIIPRDIVGLLPTSFAHSPQVDVVVGHYHFHDGQCDLLDPAETDS